MAKIRREFKNVVYNYTDAEVKVREATSNDPWGPSGTVLSELAEYTYHIQAYSLVMGMLWKRLNDHGKNWRHVYKSLVVLEYLVKSGSQRVVQQCKDNMFSIETLKDFQYIDKDGKDQGTLIREKAKNLSALLKDDQKLEDERVKASKAKGRVTATAGFGSNTESASTRSSRTPDRGGSGASSTARKSSTPSGRFEQDHMTQTRPSAKDEEDLQLQLALRMSKEQAEKDEELKKQEEESLKLALELSKQDNSGEGDTLEEQTHEENDSHEGGDDLLGLGDPWSKPPSYEAITTPPSSDDPWVPPATTTTTDPFGGNDPFKASSPPPSSLDPWKPTPISPPAGTTMQSFGDEFGGPSSNDQWGNNSAVTTSSTAPTDFSTLPPVDIGLSATTITDNTTSLATDPYDFSAFSVPLADSVTSSSDNNVGDAKDMQGVEESFLGANAGLVNLDTLIQPLPPPSSINQFGVPSGGPSPSLTRSNNPFESNKTQAPTLQQLQLGGGDTSGSIGFDPLPPPLLPGTTTTTQPPSNTFNPFS